MRPPHPFIETPHTFPLRPTHFRLPASGPAVTPRDTWCHPCDLPSGLAAPLVLCPPVPCPIESIKKSLAQTQTEACALCQGPRKGCQELHFKIPSLKQVFVRVCVHAQAGLRVCAMGLSQRFSPFTVWVLGIKGRLSGLAAGTCAH